MQSETCVLIENEVDALLSFLPTGDISAFPPTWFDRDLASSAAFYVSLISVGALIVFVAVLFFGPKLRAKWALDRTAKGYAPLSVDGVEMNSSFMQQSPNPRGGKRRDVQCENLGLKLKSGAVVLRDINYTFKSGKLTALMGPSGSGKTSLLTAVAGRTLGMKVSGKTLINGVATDLNRYQRTIGFVPQEDTMMRDCTVNETLKFSARIRSDRSMSLAERDRIVNDVQSILGLNDVANSLIGDENIRGVSGGQRKRVNVGIELVAQPSVLLLDEPTSGLDSGGSMELIRVLRQLADDRSITVVAVIHQPSFSLLSLFDSIVLLSKGGRMAYAGPVKSMKNYFEDLGFVFPASENAVDVCLDAVSGLRTSTNPAVTVASIPELWMKRNGGEVPREGLEPVPNDFDEEEVSDDDDVNPLEELEQPMEQRLPDTPGVRRDFWRMFLVCFLFPPLSLMSFYSTRFRTRASQLGAVSGSSCMILLSMVILDFVFPIMLSRFGASDFKLFFSVYAIAFSSINILVSLVALIAALRSYKRPFSLSVLAHFQMAVALGPFLLPAVFIFREKLRYAARLGFGLWLVAFGVVFGTSFVIEPFYGHHRDTVFTVTAPILYAEFFLLFFPTIGFSYMAVSAIRWNHLPSSDRLIASFLAQTWFQFVRASRQYLRDVFGVGLDLFLPMFTGFATGVLSLGKQWTPPLTEVSDWAANATLCLGCQQIAVNSSAKVQALCKLVSLNNDPYPALSLMSGMGLGLAAVTSSLRLFSNKAVFKRESRAGMSTEAHFLGRMLLHLLVSVAATFLFSISLYWLVAPQCSFGPMFGVFLLIYLACSGLGFWTSILLSPSLSGIIGILGVLSFVLFGGSLFEYGVAFPPIQYPLSLAFWFISLLSPMRWSYELLVLIIMKPFQPFMKDKDFGYLFVLFGFSYDHYYQAWVALALLCFLLRVVPYVTMVRQERK